MYIHCSKVSHKRVGYISIPGHGSQTQGGGKLCLTCFCRLLSLVVACCHLLSLVVTCCYLLLLVVPGGLPYGRRFAVKIRRLAKELPLTSQLS